MNWIFSIVSFIVMQTKILYDFNKKSPQNDWEIINDGVMGGISRGTYYIDEEGFGVFKGVVSTENNGGFSSVRYDCKNIKTTKESSIILYLKGDKKVYQVRIKDKKNNYYSYITHFNTTGSWETIEIKLADLYPSFRGTKLNLPNYNSNTIEELAFLIGNKKNESFTLMLNKIELK